jgi:glycosyltransferase involved in cell wall biosynthesis
MPADRILLVYQAPWDWDFLWNRSQPLAQALAGHVEVLYLDCGVSYHDRVVQRINTWFPKFARRLSIRLFKFRKLPIAERLTRLRWVSSINNPWFLTCSDLSPVTYRRLRELLSTTARDFDQVWLLTSRPGARGLLDLWPWDRLLVDLEDPWLSLTWATHFPRERIIQLLHRADVIFANGPRIAEEYTTIAGREVYDLPNGIDQSFLDRLATEDLPRPSWMPQRAEAHNAVFTGHINDRIDLAGLERMVTALPNVDFVFIGKVSLPDAVRPMWHKMLEHPNLHLLPPVSHAEVPAILTHADMLLLPYAHMGGTTMFPAKLFEYLAAGKPIISSVDFSAGKFELPSLRVCESIETMIAAIDDVATGRWTIDVANVKRCREIAESNTWDRRADEFLRIAAANPCRMEHI